MSIILSILALLSTFYQLYLQRLHNEKSLKPLGQIVLADRDNLLAVHLHNNGLGPLIIKRIACHKNGVIYSSIEDCLNLERQSYMHTSTNDSVTRVVLPNASLPIFETQFEGHEGGAAIDQARKQLAPITLKVAFRDIYNNNMVIERDFQWFVRHIPVDRVSIKASDW